MAHIPLNRPVRPAANLRATVFEDVDMNLFELYAAVIGSATPGLISGRTFRRCRIQGPAILLASSGVHFENTNLGDARGDIRNLLLRPMGDHAFGTVPMRDCLFDNCEFYNVGFTGPQSFLDVMSGVGA